MDLFCSRMKLLAGTTVLVLGLAIPQPVHAALNAEQIKSLPPPASGKIVFGRDIKPIIERSCINCHGHGRTKGGLQLDTRETLLRGGDSGPAVVPGQSQQSLLIELVAGVDPDNVMPKKGSRLTPAQVGLLRAWIDAGLPWDPKINFARPEPLNLKPEAPREKVSLKSKVNPIDQILRPYFASRQVKVPAVVSDRVFARRVYLDVIGLLPSREELEEFAPSGVEESGTRQGANLKSRSMLAGAEKRAELVRHLLSENDRYAEHWLSFWNDLLRNDYRGTGYIDGGRKQISGWLYSALLTNMPYDRFVARLIDPAPECEGFVDGIIWRGVVNASQTPQMQAAQNISQVFMGVNLKCASCHDSFINDWRLSDSYGLASVYSETPLEMSQCDKPTGQRAEARFIYPQLGGIDAHAPRSERLKQLAAIICGPQDGRLPRTVVNRLWARFFGRGLIEPVDDMEQKAWNQDLLDWLAEDLVANHYDIKKTIERILTSRAYQLKAVDLGEMAGKDYVFRGPGVRRMTAEQFRDALGEITGVWLEKNEVSGSTERVRAALAVADPLATALGRPDREQVVTQRASAATTLQALELTNGHTMAEVLERGAEKIAASGQDTEAVIERLYQESLGRPPTAPERSLAAEMVGQPVRKSGVEDLLWGLAMLPEFQLIY